jgi:hypothetical protein
LAWAIVTVVNFAVVSGARSAESTSGWLSLFNGHDFAGWDKILAALPGSESPLGWNNDPRDVFTVVQIDGAPAIRVSGEIYGAITTRAAFDNFHLRLQIKWGEKRWPPRATVARDTGILYCAVGEPNPGTGWLTSVENNIMERGIGQWWSVNGAIIDVEGEFITPAIEASIPYQKEGEGERNIVYRHGAPRLTATPANGITPAFDVEKPRGEWNTVEVIFWAGHCIHLLNGRVNMILTNPRYMQDDREIPLRSGKIQLQSEAAECFYRDIQIRPITEIPREYLAPIPSWQDAEQGFQSLLAANATDAWRQSGPGGFRLSNGVATAHGGMGLWWYAGRAFTNFVLRGEFVQEQQAADSGIFVRFPDPGNDPWVAVRQGHEMEIGDPEPENPTWRTGSMYPFKAAAGVSTKSPGEWNQFEMLCAGHDYSVRINDRTVTTWSDPEKRTAAGYIGLQNYDDGKTVRFRNLRVKHLP